MAQLAFWNDEFGKRSFVAGDRFTNADITALIAIDMMPRARLERPAGLAHLERWYAEVSGRPSAKA